MPSATASASASSRHSAGSDGRRHEKASFRAVVASHGPLISADAAYNLVRLPKLIAVAAPLREGLCRPLAHHRNGSLDSDFLDLVEKAHLTF
jgi:hypothetical protein